MTRLSGNELRFLAALSVGPSTFQVTATPEKHQEDPLREHACVTPTVTVRVDFLAKIGLVRDRIGVSISDQRESRTGLHVVQADVNSSSRNYPPRPVLAAISWVFRQDPRHEKEDWSCRAPRL